MKSLQKYIVVICFFLSCKENNSIETNTTTINPIDDLVYVINNEFNNGDIRRYGVFPNKPINTKRLNACLELAQKGQPLFFPKGTYDTSIILEGVSNISLEFDDAIITGLINIINKDSVASKNISITGQLTILDKLFIRHSQTIEFDHLRVKTDTLNSQFKKKNRGVSIYVGSENITFKKLEIYNTGGDEDEHYRLTAAALQVHGWNNNPKKLLINNLVIKDVDRTALYLTGYNHKISKVTIDGFGYGESDFMAGMDDVNNGFEKEFSGAWINKCNDCQIDSLSVSNNFKTGKYSVVFGIGNYSAPTFINNIQIKGEAKNLDIRDDPLTNILVKKKF